METLNIKTLGEVVPYSTLIFGIPTHRGQDIYANLTSHKHNILERYSWTWNC